MKWRKKITKTNSICIYWSLCR